MMHSSSARVARAATAAMLSLLPSSVASAQASVASAPTRYPLVSADGLHLHNVTATAATHAGKRGVRVTTSPEAQRRVEGLPVEQQSRFERLAVIDGTDFANGAIEAEIAGAPAPGAAAGRAASSASRSAAAVGAIRADVDAGELLLAGLRIAAPASDGDAAQARRMMALLVDGLRYGARASARTPFR